jgi:hypothetical protein
LPTRTALEEKGHDDASKYTMNEHFMLPGGSTLATQSAQVPLTCWCVDANNFFGLINF